MFKINGFCLSLNMPHYVVLLHRTKSRINFSYFINDIIVQSTEDRIVFGLNT